MMTDKIWLQVVYSYLKHQINPQKSIPLDYLSSLNVEDLDAVTEDMFEYATYTEDNVKSMLEALSLMIHKQEDEEIRTENALTNLITQYPNDTELGREIRKRYGRTT
jgi:hypothetical protein